MRERVRRAYSMLSEWTSIFANNPYICSNYDPFGCGQCLYALCWHRCRDLDTHIQVHTPSLSLIKQRRTEISCFWSISNQLIMVIFPGNVNKYFVASYIREWEWEGEWECESVAPERRAIYLCRWYMKYFSPSGAVKTLDKRCLPTARNRMYLVYIALRGCPWLKGNT